MKKLKNIISLTILAIAVLGIGAHKAQTSSAPGINSALTETQELPSPAIIVEKDTLAIEVDPFNLESVETAAEGLSELYIEDMEE